MKRDNNPVGSRGREKDKNRAVNVNLFYAAVHDPYLSNSGREKVRGYLTACPCRIRTRTLLRYSALAKTSQKRHSELLYLCPLLVILATALGLSRGELAGVKRNVGRMGDAERRGPLAGRRQSGHGSRNKGREGHIIV